MTQLLKNNGSVPFMHLSSASLRGGPRADVGEYGDFMGTLQHISALVVGEMWGLRFLNALLLRRLERVFRCYIVCETMEDYKEGCLMVWANSLYVSLQLHCWAIL